jgi:hypothetical protein
MTHKREQPKKPQGIIIPAIDAGEVFKKNTGTPENWPLLPESEAKKWLASDLEDFVDTFIGSMLRLRGIPYKGTKGVIGPMASIINMNINTSPAAGDVRYIPEYNRSVKKLTLEQRFASAKKFNTIYAEEDGHILASLESLVEAYTDPAEHVGTLEFRKNKIILFPNATAKGEQEFYMLGLHFSDTGESSVMLVSTEGAPGTNCVFVAKRYA